MSKGSTIVVVAIAAFCLQVPCSAQCSAPEVVKGADEYNVMVCQASEASQKGDYKKALKLYLAASEQNPLFEFPNILVFGSIARTYARLGQFQEADLYLEYDNLSLLWLIGVVRCQALPSSDDEILLQDGKLLQSKEATHMQNVLCGEIYDNNQYFRDRDADSFIPAAKAILRHGAIHKEIDLLRRKQLSNRGRTRSGR
ncbi:MAG: hypothetical protein ABSB30_13565 [Terracidiphilus sp.]|jgi:tetratricopeptide (TPR) repeat protein